MTGQFSSVQALGGKYLEIVRERGVAEGWPWFQVGIYIGDGAVEKLSSTIEIHHVGGDEVILVISGRDLHNVFERDGSTEGGISVLE